MPGGRHRSGGFTLVEMLAALAVVAMAGLIGAPLAGRALDRMELRTSARQLASALAATRGHAIASGRPAVISFSPETRSYRVADSPPVPLPDGAALSATAAAEISSGQDGIARIAFFPDGGSTGGTVNLVRDRTGYRIAVDWLTGRIETQSHAR